MTVAPDLPTWRTLGSQPESMTGPRGGELGAQRVGELLGDGDVLGAADAAADADDHLGRGEVDALVRGRDRLDEGRPQAVELGGRRELRRARPAPAPCGSSCRAAELIANTAGSGSRTVACSCPP